MTIEIPSVLAFERKLDPSDALFFSGNWDDQDDTKLWSAIEIREKSVRGTISNRLKSGNQDAAKMDAAVENPNLQTIDVASLPTESDTLRVSFSLRVLGSVGRPSACNNVSYQQKLLQTVDAYKKKPGFGELSRRYAYNLANGRFLWRNRIGADNILVRIEYVENGQTAKSLKFDALDLSTRDFEVPESMKESLDSLAGLICKALSGNGHALLRITAFVRIGHGQEVYPSQELVLDREKSSKSKTLYSVQGVAAMHSQKLGNAIRTIDDWYAEAQEFGPIAIEPYGSVTTLGKACRKPREKDDYYSIIDAWLLKDKMPPLEQQHFVMGMLIRGGVFGKGNK